MDPPPPPTLTAQKLAVIQADEHPDVEVARRRWKGGKEGGTEDVGGLDGGKRREWWGVGGWEHS